MTDTIKVTESGQVTIPKHLRDKYKITSDTKMKITTIGSSIILQKNTNKDIISYSFLYNQVTKLQYELSKQRESYQEQQENIISLSIKVQELIEKVK